MSFVRPEARAAIWRCRELIAGGAIGLLGASWVAGTGGLVWWLGWVLVTIGAAGTIIGLQRLRFRIGVGGPGVVQVDEGQISYFGPLTGGAVALSELERLRLDHTATPSHWVLDMAGQPSLQIPVNAEGSDALFDAFSTLPGLRTERMLSELRKPGSHQVVIWERLVSHTQVHRLH